MKVIMCPCACASGPVAQCLARPVWRTRAWELSKKWSSGPATCPRPRASCPLLATAAASTATAHRPIRIAPRLSLHTLPSRFPLRFCFTCVALEASILHRQRTTQTAGHELRRPPAAPVVVLASKRLRPLSPTAHPLVTTYRPPSYLHVPATRTPRRCNSIPTLPRFTASPCLKLHAATTLLSASA